MAREMTLTWLRRGNHKRETESLSVASENNAIRTNYAKVKSHTTDKNGKCMLCGDNDETSDHVISKCIKLAKKEYKKRCDLVTKVIHCKRLEFDPINKSESVKEIEMHEILWDVEIQTDHTIPSRR